MKFTIKTAFIGLLLLIIGCNDEIENPTSIDKEPAKAKALFELTKLGDGEIKLDNLSENADTYFWDFGDSKNSSRSNPVHKYDSNGVFEVSLTASNAESSDKFNLEVEIDDIEIDSWQQLEDFPGRKRFNALEFKIKGKFYVGFGIDYETYIKDLWEYDPETSKWTQKNNPPEPIQGGVSFVIGNYAYVGLGRNNNSPNTSFWRYNPSDDSWIELRNFPGYGGHSTITGASSFVHNGHGYVINGLEDYVTFNKEFWRYNPNDDSWTRLNDFPGMERHLSSSFKIDDKFYLACGAWAGGGGNEVFFNHLWEYNLTNNSWTQLKDFPGEGRIGALGFTLNGKGYVGLGLQQNRINDYYDNKYFSDLWQYDPKKDQWKRMNDFPDVTRAYAFIMEFENKVWIGTGQGELLKEFASIWEYRID